ncbi:MAG: hypothetical protein IMF14_01000, partial [Proteobacteria bacterium]|nr:hypothetical protein [Pseudomonadota bacterium]
MNNNNNKKRTSLVSSVLNSGVLTSGLLIGGMLTSSNSMALEITPILGYRGGGEFVST